MKQNISSSVDTNGIEKDGAHYWIVLSKTQRVATASTAIKNYHDVPSIIMKTETHLLDEEALL